jgi:hypothetical protein
VRETLTRRSSSRGVADAIRELRLAHEQEQHGCHADGHLPRRPTFPVPASRPLYIGILPRIVNGAAQRAFVIENMRLQAVAEKAQERDVAADTRASAREAAWTSWFFEGELPENQDGDLTSAH